MALGATEELRVNDGVRISATNEVDFAPVTNVGGYTNIGHYTRTGHVYGGGEVYLRGSIIQGDVVASAYFEQWGTTISGSFPPPTRAIVPHTVSWTAAFPTEVSTLGAGLSLTPAAGAYGVTLIVVGEFDPDTVETRIRERFADWQGQPAPPSPDPGPFDFARRGGTPGPQSLVSDNDVDTLTWRFTHGSARSHRVTCSSNRSTKWEPRCSEDSANFG